MMESVGRVIESNIGGFTAVCHELDSAPPLGALLVTLDSTPPLYAVVAGASTEPRDPGRQPMPRGGPSDDRATVLAQNPQIPALLHTVFEAIVVGYEAHGQVVQMLPESPAPIYGRARPCTSVETARFFEQFDALKLLLGAGPLAAEVVAACIRRAAAGRADSRHFLVQAGRALAAELATDPERLTSLLARIRPAR